MPHKIAIYNEKGGVGKSTLATNLSHGLALADYKVLLIDLDHQNDCSLFLNIEEDEYNETFFELLNYEANIEDCIIEARKNLDLIPNSNFREIESILYEERNNIKNTFDDIINSVDHYDYIFFDCGPSDNYTNIATLHYVDSVIIPLKMKLASIKGIKNTYNSITELGFDPNLIKLLVPSMYDVRTKINTANLEKVKEVFDDIVTEPIRNRVKIAECAEEGQTIFEYDSNADEQFIPILKEVVNLE